MIRCRQCGQPVAPTGGTLPFLWISPDVCTDCVLNIARTDAQEWEDDDVDLDDDTE